MFKRNLFFTIALIGIFSIAATVREGVSVQYPAKSGKIFYMSCVLDSADKDTSASMDLSQYDNAYWSTLPFRYELDVTADSGHVDSVRIVTYIDGSVNGTDWYPVDTLYAMTDTGPTGFIDTTLTGTANFNNHKYPSYRQRTEQTVTGSGVSGETFTVINRLWTYQD